MSGTAGDWREGRRESARAAVVAAAWTAVQQQGLASLSLRDLARRAGTTTPTIYAYFTSKNDIYNAMFHDAASEFESCITAAYSGEGARGLLLEGVRRFMEFCTADVPRYQLLFQRTIPGFGPTPAAYAPAVRALQSTIDRLATNGITDQRHVDLWTALTTGLVDQQISNDPGGDRWTRLAEDAISFFLAYCQEATTNRGSNRK